MYLFSDGLAQINYADGSRTGHKRDRLVISVGITPSMPLIPIGSMVPIKSAAAVIKMPTGPLLGKMASIPIPIIPRAR